MKKNKYVILIFLAILCLMLFILFFPNKEGMDVPCVYQYLSPNQNNVALDDNTINKFMWMYNIKMIQMGSGLQLNRFSYNLWIQQKVFCSDEVNFYIQFGFFPINQYILGALQQNASFKMPAPFYPSTIAYGFSTRMIFFQIMLPIMIQVQANSTTRLFDSVINIANGVDPECPPPPPPVVPSTAATVAATPAASAAASASSVVSPPPPPLNVNSVAPISNSHIFNNCIK